MKIIDKDEVFNQKSLCDSKSHVRDLGLHPSIKLISEAGMYQAIFGSQLPSAKFFKRWVTKEVLPSIRKTGGYSTAPAIPDFSNPAEAARAWANEFEAKQKALEEKQKAIEIANSRKKTIDNVIHNNNTYTATQIAKDMEVPITAKFLNKILNEAGVIYKSGGTWVLYKEHIQYRDRLMSIKETKPNADGNTYTSSRWTVEGKAWIMKHWAKMLKKCTPETRAKWESIRDKGEPDRPSLPDFK